MPEGAEFPGCVDTWPFPDRCVSSTTLQKLSWRGQEVGWPTRSHSPQAPQEVRVRLWGAGKRANAEVTRLPRLGALRVLGWWGPFLVGLCCCGSVPAGVPPVRGLGVAAGPVGSCPAA